MSMITPVSVQGFPQYARPWNNITPFTYRDGMTYLEVIESLRLWLKNTLVPHINSEMLEIGEAWNAEVLALVAEIDSAITDANATFELNHGTAKTELDTIVSDANATFDAMVLDINTRADQWLATQISNNDEITTTIVDDINSTTRASITTLIRSITLTEVVTNANGSNGPNITLGSVENRRGASIADDVAGSVIINPGAGAGQNNVAGGDGSATVGTSTPNATTPGTNASISVIAGYDNVAGSLSSKIISDHSFTEVGGDGHNAIVGGANNIARQAAAYAGIFAGYLSEVAGRYAFVTGYRNKGRAQSVSVTGNDNDVSGTGSTADGAYNIVSGAYSAAVGNRNVVLGGYGRADGQYAKTRDAYQQTFAPGKFTNDGDSQTSVYIINRKTPNDALAPLGIGGSAVGPMISPNTTFVFTAIIGARHEDGTDSAGWEIKGMLQRGETGAPTVIGTPTITALGASTGAAAWAIYSVSGGSTGGLQIVVKGDGVRTVRWIARITVVEVGASTVVV